jgi:hypothetical protein
VRATIICAVVGAVVLAGCGGVEKSAPSAGSTAGPPAPATTAKAAPATTAAPTTTAAPVAKPTGTISYTCSYTVGNLSDGKVTMYADLIFKNTSHVDGTILATVKWFQKGGKALKLKKTVVLRAAQKRTVKFRLPATDKQGWASYRYTQSGKDACAVNTKWKD